MSKYTGGIFSRAAGATGDVVFSAARDRKGKKMTSRQRIAPLNPNTPAQVSARDNFKDTLDIVRNLGAGFYQQDWNRSISKLPGYQSLFSVMMNAKRSDGTNIIVEAPPPQTPLGKLERQNYSIVSFSDSTYQLSWSPATSFSGLPGDIAHGFTINRIFPITSIGGFRVNDQGLNTGATLRSDGSLFIDMGGFPGETSGVLVCLYFTPAAGSSVFSPSPAIWKLVDFNGNPLP